MTVTERVELGCALLDEHAPGWYHSIDVESLWLQFPDVCVLGQVFGGYDAGIRFLYGRDDRDCLTGEHGFAQQTIDEAWEPLTTEWRRVVAERQDATALPDWAPSNVQGSQHELVR